jgi:hypothetical protein
MIPRHFPGHWKGSVAASDEAHKKHSSLALHKHKKMHGRKQRQYNRMLLLQISNDL